MTRKHYIKKLRYLRWSLSQLPCNENLHYRDIYWSISQKNIPTPSELGCSYAEAWEKVAKVIRTIEGMEDFE